MTIAEAIAFIEQERANKRIAEDRYVATSTEKHYRMMDALNAIGASWEARHETMPEPRSIFEPNETAQYQRYIITSRRIIVVAIPDEYKHVWYG